MIRSLTNSLKMLRGEVGALCLALFLSFMAMGGVYPIFPLYLATLGVTVGQYGFMSSLRPVGEGIFGLIWGSQTDKRGIGFPLAVRMFGGALIFLVLILNRYIPAFFVIMFAQGAVGAAVWPAGRAFLGASFPQEKKGLAMAVFGTVASGGMSLGSLIGGYVADLFGYQAVFYQAILLLSVGGFIVVARLRNAKLIKGEASPGVAGTSRAEPTLSRRRLATYLAILGLIQVIIALVFIDGRPFVPLLARSLPGVQIADIGRLYAVVSLVNLLLLIPIGRLSDRSGRKLLIVAGLGISCLGLWGLAYASSLAQLAIFMAMGGIGRSATNPPMLALLSDIAPTRLQGLMQGFYVICDDGGFMLGPAIGGLAWENWGARPTFLFYAVLAGVGFSTAAVFIRERDWLRKARPITG